LELVEVAIALVEKFEATNVAIALLKIVALRLRLAVQSSYELLTASQPFEFHSRGLAFWGFLNSTPVDAPVYPLLKDCYPGST
jgi:hypothetical protein